MALLTDTPSVQPVAVQPNLNTVTVAPPPEPLIKISPPGAITGALPDPDTVEAQAQKTHQILGDQSPGVDVLRADFAAGNEDRIRRNAALADELAFRKQKMIEVQKITTQAAAEGRPLSAEDHAQLMSLTQAQVSNPDTVLERKAGKFFVDSLTKDTSPSEDNLAAQAADENPEETGKTFNAAQAMAERQAAAQDIFTKGKAKYDQSSWLRWGWDLGKTFIPLYSWNNIRSNLKGIAPSSLLTGNNLEDQIASLYLLPLDEFKARAQASFDEISSRNEIDGIAFAQALISYSSTDKAWDNLWNTLDVVTAPATAIGAVKTGAKVLKAAGALRKGARVAEDAAEFIKPVRPPPEAPETPVRPPKGPTGGSGGQHTFAESAEDAFQEEYPSAVAPEDLSTTNMSKVLKDRVKAALRANATAKPAKPSDVQAAAGNVEKAASTRAMDTLSKAADETAPKGTPPRLVSDLLEQQPGLLDPRVYARNTGTMANEQARRLVQGLANTGNNLRKIWSDASVLPRVTNPKAIDLMFSNARADFLKTYPKLEDTVLEVIPERTSEQVFGGVDHINIYLGHKDATPFSTAKQAENFAKNLYRLPEGGYDVVKYKGSYAIRATKTVDETREDVRLARIGTDNQPASNLSKLWQDILNTTRVNALRTPDDILTASHREGRAVLTYGGNEALRYMREAAKPLGKLSKEQKLRQSQIMNGNRFEMRDYTLPDGTVKSLPGNWYDTFGEFEVQYQKRFGELPKPEEVEAYFTFRQISLWDWYSRNISMYRDKARIGGELKSISFPAKGEDGTVKVVSSDFFEGRTVPTLPQWNAQPFTVAWVNAKGKKMFYLSTKMSYKERKELEEMVAAGKVNVIQPLNANDPVIKALADSRGEVVNYILSNNVKTKPLNSLQVEYRYGLHDQFSATGNYLKQPTTWRGRFGRRLVGADKTLMYFATEAQARRFGDAFNTAREMINSKVSQKALSDFVKANLPYKSGKEFKALFRDPLDPKSEGFDLRTPFVVTKPGQRATAVHDLRSTFPEEMYDLSTSEHNPMVAINQKFSNELGGTSDNSLQTIDELGTEKNPVYKLIPTPQIDPMEVMKRTAHELMQNRFIEDYKHSAVEDWITQFKNLLEIPPADVAGNPLQSLKNPRWKAGANVADRAAAQNARRAILYLIGQQTPVKDAFVYLRSKVMDEAYTRFGEKGVKAIDPVLWTERTNPLGMLRGFAFSAKFGFNPAQLWLQAQSFLTAAAIDGNPVRALQANMLAFMHRAMRMGEFNPEYQSMLGRVIRNSLNISKEDYLEMYTAIKKSGMLNVGGEVATLDDYFDPNILGNNRSKLWNGVNFFFTEGERWVRMTAWNTAYLAWKAKNPGVKLTANAERAIIDRANLMAMNMTRASNNPVLQGKIGGQITQWATFQIRTTEMMLSGGLTNKGRLTLAEKARMMLLYSAMYGVPTGVAGLTAGAVYPAYEEGRKWMLEHNMDPSDPKVKAFFEGLPTFFLSYLFGSDVNFSERFGPGGLTWLKDLKDGDITPLFGPSTKIILSAIQKAEPFTRSLLGVFNPEPDEQFPLTAADFLDAFKDISVVNNVASGWYAFNTGLLLTSGGMVVDTIDKRMAVLKMLTSLQPQSASDVWLKKESLDEQREAKNVLEKEALKYFTRALQNTTDGSTNEAVANFQKARTLLMGGGYTPLELGNIWKRMMSAGKNGTFVDQIGEDFILKAPPDDRLERLRQLQEQNNAQ